MDFEHMSPSEQLNLRVLRETVSNPTFGDALFSAEWLLEAEDFSRVRELLEPLLTTESARKSSLLFLSYYYLGQAIFRREMKRSRPKLKGIRKAMDHLKRSVTENPDFPDAHLLLTWTRMIHHKLDPEHGELHETIPGLHAVIKIGNRIQVAEAQHLLTLMCHQDISQRGDNETR